MKEQRPELKVIQGGKTGEPITREQVPPTTGLSEGQVGLKTEGNSSLFRIRRALARLAEKLDTNKENKPPIGKAF